MSERNQLRILLTEKKASNDRPLFTSGRELAAIVCDIGSIEDNPFFGEDRKPGTTSFVNQVFRGDRACNDNLRIAIKRAVQHQLALIKGDDSVHEWLEQVDRYAAEAVRRKLPKDPQSRDSFAQAESQANEIVVFNTSPYASPTPSGHSLRASLATRLMLFSPSEDERNTLGMLPDVTYTLCSDPSSHPNNRLRYIFYNVTGLIGRHPLNSPMNPEDADKRMLLLEDARSFNIVTISSELCGIPVIALNPVSDNPRLFIPLMAPDSLVMFEQDVSLTRYWLSTVHEAYLNADLRIGSWKAIRDRVLPDVENKLRHRTPD
jgi:hypothetical protein